MARPPMPSAPSSTPGPRPQGRRHTALVGPLVGALVAGLVAAPLDAAAPASAAARPEPGPAATWTLTRPAGTSPVSADASQQFAGTLDVPPVGVGEVVTLLVRLAGTPTRESRTVLAFGFGDVVDGDCVAGAVTTAPTWRRRGDDDVVRLEHVRLRNDGPCAVAELRDRRTGALLDRLVDLTPTQAPPAALAEVVRTLGVRPDLGVSDVLQVVVRTLDVQRGLRSVTIGGHRAPGVTVDPTRWDARAESGERFRVRLDVLVTRPRPVLVPLRVRVQDGAGRVEVVDIQVTLTPQA
ncbi:hypothetical protein [Nocardioides sp.]|uniref:hypothetical protein n=1 Tax=Nocardioides sp. TaxID=35761 RepID=UPI0035180CD2